MLFNNLSSQIAPILILLGTWTGGMLISPGNAQTPSQNDTSIVIPSTGSKPVYSPNTLSPRLNSPKACNITITNNTPYPQTLLYGVSYGSWKSTGITVAPGGVAGWGVSVPMKSLMSLSSNTNAVLVILCR
jgi:hypothetical protein